MTPDAVSAPLTVLVAGASGMIGTELTRQLTAAGHSVLTLVRHPATRPGEYTWSPSAGGLDSAVLDAADAIVDLSGASISKIPWTRSYKKEILDSRLGATRTLTAAMRRAENPPRILVNASAVGFYGDRPGERLTENSSRGDGFLADVVVEWEAAAHEAPEDTRVATLRTGVVIGPGGALKPLTLLTKFGVSGPLAGGRQVWPWISLHDEAAAIVHLLTSDLHGPVNLAGPTAATAGELMQALATAMHRPYWLPAPRFAITALLGEAGRELLLGDQHEVPEKLEADGFEFRHRTAAEAIGAVVGSV